MRVVTKFDHDKVGIVDLETIGRTGQEAFITDDGQLWLILPIGGKYTAWCPQLGEFHSAEYLEYSINHYCEVEIMEL